MSLSLQNILAFHSSPAICGIKSANLIRIKMSETLCEEIEELNKKYPKLCFYILRQDEKSVLVLVYRKENLKNELFEDDNKSFLSNIGYDTYSVESMLNSLKERMNNSTFPHEIGVFLGYDLSDIKSYIEGKKCLYIGCWKVYSNVEKKKEIFSKYERCRNTVMRLINEGFPIENFMK